VFDDFFRRCVEGHVVVGFHPDANLATSHASSFAVDASRQCTFD
jgi:hypothetical protein